jgi:hypothetical protein
MLVPALPFAARVLRHIVALARHPVAMNVRLIARARTTAPTHATHASHNTISVTTRGTVEPAIAQKEVKMDFPTTTRMSVFLVLNQKAMAMATPDTAGTTAATITMAEATAVIHATTEATIATVATAETMTANGLPAMILVCQIATDATGS